jgi:signal transduction histidine kinase
MRAAVGLKEEHFKQARFALGEYVAGQVVATGEMIYVPDTYADPNFRIIDPDLRSLLAVPLTVQDRTIGTLSIDSAEPRAFTPDHERLLTIAGSQIAAAIETVRLLEETRQHAEQLAAANAELAALDELRTKLLQDVSHELRSPLALVRGYAGLLRDAQLGDVTHEQVEALDIIDQRADLITKLIGDILAAEQISPKTLELGPVDIAQLCANAVEGMRLVHHDAGVTFELDLQAEECWVHGDRNRLSQVLDNLLGNAAKFSPDGGMITVRARLTDDGKRVVVTVTDEGIGIAADRLPHLFERFYQGDRMVKHRFGGTGLGLYIVKQIIEAHGGTVSVESHEGEGSTFSFALTVGEG